MSGCYCEYGSATDFPDFFAQKTVKARKPHQCCECLEPTLMVTPTTSEWVTKREVEAKHG